MSRLAYFETGQRVIVHCDGIAGERGIVARKNWQSREAWIALDKGLPPDMRAFPEGDSRAGWILLWPHECEAEAEVSE